VNGNKTWTDMLQWEVTHFDIAADYWGRSQERMALGVCKYSSAAWFAVLVVLFTSSNGACSVVVFCCCCCPGH
jgi:hypothetical protein